MGKRGPKSSIQKLFDKGEAVPTWEGEPPWKRPGMALWERVVSFINILPITSGKLAGQKMKLRPWQVDIIKKLFKTDKAGKRAVRTAIITLPRKNGKTLLAASLILAAMGDGPLVESRGQCFSLANDREQAAIIYAELEAWIFAVPEFTDLFNIKAFQKKIECLVTGTIYTALSRDSRKAHGLSPSLAIYDEAAQSYDSKLWDNVSSGTGARDEPLCMIISTQAADDDHWFSQLIDYGRKIQSGMLPPDDSFLLIEYSAGPDDEPYEEKTWFKANPALDDFRSLDELRKFAEQAQKIPAKDCVFKNLYLNMRVSTSPLFVAREDWEACKETAPTSGPCFGGLDLGSSQDLTALVLYWPDTGAVRCWSWLPGEPSLIERGDRDKVPYNLWEEKGFIETWPGKVTDLRGVAERLAEITVDFDIQAVAYDRWRIQQLKIILDEMGVEIPLEPWGQGYRDMSPAVESLEKLILSHALRHGGNPVLTWCMSNVQVDRDPAGNVKFNKGKAQHRRIDAAQALAMAAGIASRQAAEEPLNFESSLMTL
jgi:phage terminase large subunit-like protein